MTTIIIDVLYVTPVQVCGIQCFAAKTVFNSCIRRAGAILNLPFVKKHLAILIKEKEALHAK